MVSETLLFIIKNYSMSTANDINVLHCQGSRSVSLTPRYEEKVTNFWI